MVSERDVALASDPMAFSSSSSSTIPANPSMLISNLSSFVTVKLDSADFIIWEKHMQNVLRATNLLKIVDGTLPCPIDRVRDSSRTEICNPDAIH